MRSTYIWILVISVIAFFIVVLPPRHSFEKAYQLKNQADAKALLTILLSSATENGGKFPASFEDVGNLVQDKKLLYKKDGVTPRWIYHPNLTISDTNKVILETIPDAKGWKIKIFVNGSTEYTREK